MAKITTVKVVRKPGRWGGYKVRLISEGGRTMETFEYHQGDYQRLRRFWTAEAKRNGQTFIGVDV